MFTGKVLRTEVCEVQAHRRRNMRAPAQEGRQARRRGQLCKVARPSRRRSSLRGGPLRRMCLHHMQRKLACYVGAAIEGVYRDTKTIL